MTHFAAGPPGRAGRLLVPLTVTALVALVGVLTVAAFRHVNGNAATAAAPASPTPQATAVPTVRPTLPPEAIAYLRAGNAVCRRATAALGTAVSTPSPDAPGRPLSHDQLLAAVQRSGHRILTGLGALHPPAFAAAHVQVVLTGLQRYLHTREQLVAALRQGNRGRVIVVQSALQQQTVAVNAGFHSLLLTDCRVP